MMPKWLLILTLIASGAGAAIGTVLSGQVTGELPVTISQALLVGKPVAAYNVAGSEWADILTSLDNEPQSVENLLPDAATLSVPDRSIGTVSDDQTTFQFAAEIDTGDFYAFWVLLKNASNQDMVVGLTLSAEKALATGITLEVVDAAGTIVENMTRTGLGTWKFKLSKNADMTTPDPTEGSEDSIFIVVAVSDTIEPGFYTIEGNIEQIA